MTAQTPADDRLPDAAQAPGEWESDALDLAAYLQRIGYAGPRTPTVRTLRALQRAHLDAIPFENLEIMTGGEIRLDIASLQGKLVHRRRGGYCHEQNILFATVLDRLGFTVAGRSARMLMGADEEELTGVGHTMLNVTADGTEWHVDVGVGNVGPREPIPLMDGIEVRHDGWNYRLKRTAAGRWLLRYLRHDGWFNIYQFSDEPFFRVDYADHSFIAARHPESPFSRRIVAQYNGAEVRHALTDRELKTFRPGAMPEQREIPAADVPEVLRSTFGMELTHDQACMLYRRARSAGTVATAAEQLGT